MTSTILELCSIEASYGDVRCLKGVDLAIEEGEIVVLLGANGAGKTSTLRSVSGTIVHRGGSVRFLDAPIDKVPAHARVGLGIGHVPEGRQIFAPLTVTENLEIGSVSRRGRADASSIRETYDLVYDLFPVLHERGQQLGGTLSGGEQQMLAIARALMAGPRFLMLDEPSLGLAPLVTESIFETLETLNRSGLTILLVEQNADLALEIADRGYVLDLGEVVHAGSAEALRNDDAIKGIYLGTSERLPAS